MARTQVHKFGGTSVGDTQRLINAARLLIDAGKDGARVCAVSSAMGGVTDDLIRATEAALTGSTDDADRVLDTITERHLATLDELGEHESARVKIDALLAEARELLHGTAMLHELGVRTRDRIVITGEKLAVRLLALALKHEGADGIALDADTFLATNDHFGEADPLSYTDDRGTVDTLTPHLDAGRIPVVTGFCGRAPDGATTTFGRGGSDLTATLLGAALRADEVVIWTDVPGVFSADPRIVPGARTIDQLHFREAAEMSFYGAKVLHPRTMIPVSGLGIPVHIRSSLEPSGSSTLVDDRFTPGDHPVKAVSAVRAQALVAVEGKGMVGVPGIAQRVFAAIANHDISVTMISQSSSEASVCMAVPDARAEEAASLLRREFTRDIDEGTVEDVTVRHGAGLIAAVGIGMAHTPGVAGRLFDSLARRGVNVLAIAQGSSELNITLAVDENDLDTAVRVIHDAFHCHERSVIIRGFGQVGRALARQIVARDDMSLVGMTDRSALVADANGFDSDSLDKLITHKASGSPLRDVPGSTPLDDGFAMPAGAAILADCTDDSAAHPIMLAALSAGHHVVTANKEPLAAPDSDYAALAAFSDRLGAEATVGAGLPIIDTLRMIRASGDTVRRIEGALSGSLGFILSRIEDGATLPDALREAAELGYTEPDPMVDLSGYDVARKVLILGRLTGLAPSISEMTCEGLVQRDVIGTPRDKLEAILTPLGTEIRHRFDDARKRDATIRFVATVEQGRASASIREVPVNSHLGRLRGTESLVCITSDRYADLPLVVSGAGAGAEVTASAMLADILRARL